MWQQYKPIFSIHASSCSVTMTRSTSVHVLFIILSLSWEHLGLCLSCWLPNILSASRLWMWLIAIIYYIDIGTEFIMTICVFYSVQLSYLLSWSRVNQKTDCQRTALLKNNFSFNWKAKAVSIAPLAANLCLSDPHWPGWGTLHQW